MISPGSSGTCCTWLPDLMTPRTRDQSDLEDYYEKEIHHGRLYPNLDTLVEKGLIEKSQRDQRTNEYTTTRRGTREIKARAEWEANYINHDG